MCKAYSAPSALEDLHAAIENLRAREMPDASAVGFVELRRQAERRRHGSASASRGDHRRLGGRERYDAAIWTALKSNFDEPDKGGELFSVTAAIRYLETLASEDADKFARALTYIRKAPPEVETPVREEVLKRWPD